MAAVALAVTALLVTLFVQGFVGGGDADALEEYVDTHGAAPVDLIADAAGARRVVVIGDLTGHAVPKQLAQQVLRRMALERGVDALVVEADTAFQTTFDRYTATTPEDASLLTRDAGLLPGGDAGRQWLELYRSVWSINEELGADRRIRIMAVGPGSWPPRTALPPKEAAELYARRGAEMADRVIEQMLERTSRSRVVALVDAMQALRSGSAELRVGGGGAIEARWFAAILADRYPVDVYTILPDASLEMRDYPLVAQYAGTRVHPRLSKAIPSEIVAMPTGGPIGEYREPIELRTGPGVTASLLPSGHTLAELADGYLFLPQ